MRTVITGSSGLLGSAVARLLLQAGHDVVGLDLRLLPDAPFRQEPADLSRAGEWERLLDGADLVVHTAAKVGEVGDPRDFARLNVDLTGHVVRASASAGRLVHFSSIVVHGREFADGVDESGPVRPTGNPYTDTKIASEHLVLAAHAGGRVRATVVRPGDVYGPRSQPWTVRPVAMLRSGSFALVDGDRGVLSPVHVDDVARGAVLAGTTDAALGQVLHLSSDGGVAPRIFFGHYARMTGTRLRSVPPRVAAAAAPVVGGAFRLLRRDPPLSDRTLEYVTHPGSYSVTAAARVLGWRPEIGLDEGMAGTEAWLREQGLLAS
ncbi:MAG: hypothetical protein JWN08_2492 [Frankiales bacterium]|nr:hypothetical protein [Frankiales bacterium]